MPQDDPARVGKLVLSAANRILREVLIDRKRLTIGRRPHNDLLLDDLTVSGDHAIVHTVGGQSVIQDLMSRNGTLINGAPVVQQQLADGDCVDIGIYRLVYRVEQLETRKAPYGFWSGVPPPLQPTLPTNLTGDRTSAWVPSRPARYPGPLKPAKRESAGDSRGSANPAVPGLLPNSGIGATPALPAVTGVPRTPVGPASFGSTGSSASSAFPPTPGTHGSPVTPRKPVPPETPATPRAPAIPGTALTPRSPSTAAKPSIPALPAAPGGLTHRRGSAGLPIPGAPNGPFSRRSGDAGKAGLTPRPLNPHRKPSLPTDDSAPASLQILGGQDAGRRMLLQRPIVSIRNGLGQVAVVAKRPAGYFVTHLEGPAYPLVNGESIGLSAHLLRDNDLIELAGTIIQFSLER